MLHCYTTVRWEGQCYFQAARISHFHPNLVVSCVKMSSLMELMYLLFNLIKFNLFMSLVFRDRDKTSIIKAL